MGISFFQTAPRDHYIRTAILFNTIALIIQLVAFGLSFDKDRGVSSVLLSTDYFKRGDEFARVSATRIYAYNNDTVICPQSDLAASTTFSTTSAAWTECERFTEVSKLTLGIDGITWILLLVLFCVQRYATISVSDERRLLGVYFGLQLIPLSFHIIARIIFDGGAIARAISFLKLSGINGGNSALSDEDVGIHYGPVQALHATVAALLTASLAFISLKFFQITLYRRIDSVELVRECAARVRGDNKNIDHPPMRWMLDPKYHPLFDFDELEVVRQKIAEEEKTTANDPNESEEIKQLRADLAVADREWEEQQQELLREEEAYKQYSHRIRREERVETRLVVDDWERQQIVWEQRKEAVAKRFEEAGFTMPLATTAADNGTVEADE